MWLTRCWTCVVIQNSRLYLSSAKKITGFVLPLLREVFFIIHDSSKASTSRPFCNYLQRPESWYSAPEQAEPRNRHGICMVGYWFHSAENEMKVNSLILVLALLLNHLLLWRWLVRIQPCWSLRIAGKWTCCSATTMLMTSWTGCLVQAMEICPHVWLRNADRRTSITNRERCWSERKITRLPARPLPVDIKSMPILEHSASTGTNNGTELLSESHY